MKKQTVIYQDQNGTLEGSLSYDGKLLHLYLADFHFSSRFMDGFSTETEVIDARFQRDAHYDLTNFSLHFQLPMRFSINHVGEFLNLTCELTVRTDEDQYSCSFLRCKLLVNNTEINLPNAGTIEGAIVQLNDLLPETIKFIGCYNCKFSDYSIYGQQFWGSMLCFKNNKEAYSKVTGKDEFMEIMDEFDQLVPESYFCDEFEERPKNTGYRG